jgi:Tfp pilus assembly protein PilF
MNRLEHAKRILGLFAGVVLLAATAAPTRAQLPTESDVYVDRGIVAYDNKQFTEALEAFQEALRLNPDNLNALYYAGLTYMALEQYGPAQAVLEQAQKLAPTDTDVAFQLGVAYFLQQQYDRAEAPFRQVYASQPRHPNLGYYLGFIEYRKQNYREALRFFQTNVPSDDNFAQLSRFYAGLSLTALGLAGQARDQIEEALRLQPSSPLTAPAERFREVLGPAVQAERSFHVDLKFGAYYDTNVAVVPGPSGDIVASAARNAPHESPGELGFVRLEYTPLRTPDWEASLAPSYLHTWNNNVAGFNVSALDIPVTLAYKTSLGNLPTIAGLNLVYDYFALSGSNYLNEYSVIPFMTLAWNAMNLTQVQFMFQAQDFMNQKNLITTADNRDGFDYLAGVTHFFRFQGDKHFIKLGYQIDWFAAQGNNWTYLGNRFLVGFQYTLPRWGWDIRIRDDFNAYLINYQFTNDYLPVTCAPCIHRNDQQFNNLLSVSKDLPYNITLSLEYLYTRNISNLAVYDYSRNVVSLNASWRY